MIECLLNVGQPRIANEIPFAILGEKFKDQASGVSIGSTLPKTVAIAVEDVDFQFGAERLMQSHFFVLVIRQSLAQ